MTDHDLEQRLRAWYRAEVDVHETAPPGLRAELVSLIPEATASNRRTYQARWVPRGPRLSAASLAAMAVVVMLVVGTAVFVRSPDVGPSPAPIKASEPAASATPSQHVTGWPNTDRNAPGVYSWNGSRCSRLPTCRMGYMRNAHGSGDVTILIGQTIAALPTEGVTQVTVAGRPGTYRVRTDALGALHEEWVFDVDGTRVAIDLTARAETSQADLDEAHAIIDSMRTEPSDSDLGFRLVFTLTTDDWAG